MRRDAAERAVGDARDPGRERVGSAAEDRPEPAADRARGARWRPPEPTQPPDVMLARERFKSGVTHFDTATFDAALADFEAAYSASAHPAVLYNIGMCLERLGRIEDAIDAYEMFLNATPNAPQASTVQQRIDALRLQLSH
jgi:tetratricopeptide (TPR) repeat protein